MRAKLYEYEVGAVNVKTMWDGPLELDVEQMNAIELFDITCAVCEKCGVSDFLREKCPTATILRPKIRFLAETRGVSEFEQYLDMRLSLHY